MKALIPTLLLLYSCSKEVVVTRDGVTTELKSAKMEISHLQELDWQVGKRKEAKVSQAFSFIVDLPKLAKDDLDYLIQNKDIDSFIIRLIFQSASRTQDLGSVYVLFKPKLMTRSNHYMPGSLSIKVSYAAAYASERFKKFECPAFEHSYKLKSFKINGENEEFDIEINQVTHYGEKNTGVSLSPSVFNGGNSLVGNYFIEIAPYNSSKKLIYSAFKRIPMSISVESEETVSIPTCIGIKSENL